MGTSSSFGGAGGGTPLIPSWLQPDSNDGGQEAGGVGSGTEPQGDPSGAPQAPSESPQTPQPGQPVAPRPDGNRFRNARSNYTRFASSGGTNRESLNRAVSSYVRSGVGGARSATIRMGASRGVAANTARLFSDIRSEGAEQALFRRGIEYDGQGHACDVLLEVLDSMDFNGGPIDEAIARNAMVESVIENLEDLDVPFSELEPAVYSVLLEDFVTKSIVSRLIMDIGMRGIYVAKDAAAAECVHGILEEVVAGAVSDSFANTGGIESVATSEYDRIVNQIYSNSYSLLQALGESE